MSNFIFELLVVEQQYTNLCCWLYFLEHLILLFISSYCVSIILYFLISKSLHDVDACVLLVPLHEGLNFTGIVLHVIKRLF